eukprot:scaffold4409_cov369-Prasinococcus_capsulatus_cf.AAC.12
MPRHHTRPTVPSPNLIGGRSSKAQVPASRGYTPPRHAPRYRCLSQNMTRRPHLCDTDSCGTSWTASASPLCTGTATIRS